MTTAIQILGNNALAADTPLAVGMRGTGGNPRSFTTGHRVGGDLVIKGGINPHYFVVFDFSGLGGDTLTVIVNGTANVLTEGAQWTAATDNATTAASLAAAINGLSAGVTYVESIADNTRYTPFIDESVWQFRLETSDGANLRLDGSSGAIAGGLDGGVVCPSGGARSTAIGFGVSAGNDSHVVGDSVNATSAVDCIALGSSAAVTTDCVSIGNRGTNAGGGNNVILIGHDSTTTVGGVCIGNTSTISGGTSAVLVGNNASVAAAGSVGVGHLATITGAGVRSVAIGQQAGSVAADSVCLGSLTNSNTAQTFQVGSRVASGTQINTVRFQNDETAPTAVTIEGAVAGNTVDLAGGNLIIRPGTGRGAATPSTVVIQTPTAGASSATPQTQTTRVTINESNATFTGAVKGGTITGVGSPGDLFFGNTSTGKFVWDANGGPSGQGILQLQNIAGAATCNIDTNTGTGSLAIGGTGNAIATGANSVAIGSVASTAAVASAVAVGQGATVGGGNGIALGQGTSAAGDTIALGTGANATQANHLGIGSSSVNITTIAFGAGDANDGVLPDVTLRPTDNNDGVTPNRDGADLTVRSGLGTGTGVASSLIFQTSTPVGAGISGHTATTRMVLVDGASSEVILGGEDTATASPGSTLLRQTDIITTADTAGPSMTIRSGGGTGNAAGSQLIFQTPDATASGTTQQSFTTQMTIDENGVNVPSLSMASLSLTEANGQQTIVDTASATTGTLSGATATLSSLIPAGCMVVGITTRVITAITGATGYDVGDGTTQDAYGANIGIGLGTTSDITDATISAAPLYTAATDVVLTALGSNFTGGDVRVTVHYIQLVAATS